MKKGVLIMVVALLVVGGVVLYSKQSKKSGGDSSSYSDYGKEKQVVNTAAPKVNDQAPAKTVLLGEVKMAENGYVVIHEDSAGKPGAVLGASAFLKTGSYINISLDLSRSTKAGETLYAMLHKDNGDGVYKFPGDDLPVTDAEGKVVLTKFNIVAEAAKTSVREITVSGNEFSFSPKDLTLKAGEQVRLTFKNTGKYPHDWVIEGLNIRTKKVAGGQTDTIEFTAPTQTGSYTYTVYCSIPGHRESGMVGKLTVQ